MAVAAAAGRDRLALTTSSATNATLIAASAPVFTLAVGASTFGERVTGRRVGGALSSIVGVPVVPLHGDASRFAALAFVPGDLSMLVAAASWSAYTWLLRKRRPALPVEVLLQAQIATGSLFAIAGALVEVVVLGVPSRLDEPRAWLVLACVALLPSLIGYVCWDEGVARAGATLPMFFANLTPVFAALLAALLLAEGRSRSIRQGSR